MNSTKTDDESYHLTKDHQDLKENILKCYFSHLKLQKKIEIS